MTREEVENLIKRFYYIRKPVKNNQSSVTFYIGKRKQVIEITDGVKYVCNLLETLYRDEQDNFIKYMIKGILSGQSDKWLLNRLPYSKNAYYERKNAFIEKVFNCCVYHGFVSLEEILMEKIA